MIQTHKNHIPQMGDSDHKDKGNFEVVKRSNQPDNIVPVFLRHQKTPFSSATLKKLRQLQEKAAKRLSRFINGFRPKLFGKISNTNERKAQNMLLKLIII